MSNHHDAPVEGATVLRPAVFGEDATLAAAPSPPQDFARPAEPGRIDRFAVLRWLGAGGMGVVYAAYDEELDRKVAIKVLREDLGVGTQGRSRMLREAQAMAQVSHPNVVHIYEVGEFAGQVFIAMEFIRGSSLKEWLAAEARPVDTVLEMFVQAGRGLAAAHRQGIVHRDFKPDNVLVDGDGVARVLDFGLARAGSAGTDLGADDRGDSAFVRIGGRSNVLDLELTGEGMLVGTPAFMSPEQFEHRPIDWRSDQFSLCVAIYAAVYGQMPFGAPDGDVAQLQAAVIAGALRPPPADTRAPPWLFDALKTGLAPLPDQRHPSMDTLLAALVPERPQRRRWLWPALTLMATTLAVVLTLWLVRPPDPTAEQLQAIALYDREAHVAAEHMQWVYPPPGDRKDTAYNRVVLLEALGGPAAQTATDTATALRSEFADALVALGDRHFDDADTRPYARDYYVQALLFMPLDPRASARASVTIGQLADLQRRASTGEFFEDELVAAEPLRILAEPDPAVARARAVAFAADPTHTGTLAQEHFAALAHKTGLIDTPAATTPEPAEPPPVIAIADPVVSPPIPTPIPEPSKGSKLRKPEPTITTPTPPPITTTPTPTPTPEPAPAEPLRDPDGSRKLSAEGDAAAQRGDVAAAEQHYKQALDLWADNTGALIGLSDLAFDGGRYDRAAKYAEKAARVDPNNGEHQIRLGDAYFKALRYTEAKARYERAAELRHPKANERLARVRAELGG